MYAVGYRSINGIYGKQCVPLLSVSACPLQKYVPRQANVKMNQNCRKPLGAGEVGVPERSCVLDEKQYNTLLVSLLRGIFFVALSVLSQLQSPIKSLNQPSSPWGV